MTKRSASSIILAVFLLSAAGVLPLRADESESWLNNSLSLRFGPAMRVIVTNETRYEELTFRGSYLRNWQAGLLVFIPGETYLGFLYKRQTEDVPPFGPIENRFTLEGGWIYRFLQGWAFNIRFRTEIRRFEDALEDNHLRLRLRAGLSTSLRFGRLRLRPFLSTEPFFDTIEDRIFRNRLSAGTAVVLSPAADVIIGYTLQLTRGQEPLHILNSGINFRF